MKQSIGVRPFGFFMKRDQTPVTMKSFYPIRIFYFYLDGFRRMTVGRTLWKVIIIKLFVMFAILKLFFFPNFLAKNFQTDQQRADHVFQQLRDRQIPQ